MGAKKISRVLVEGSDCSGKSLLIEELKNRLQWDAKLLHHIPKDQFERYMVEYASQSKVIFGRGHISEAVYGTLWRKGSPFSVNEKKLLDDFMKEKLVVVFACPKLKVLKERYIKRSYGQQIKLEELKKCRLLFLKEFKNKSYILYQSKNLKELESVLKKVIKRLQ